MVEQPLYKLLETQLQKHLNHLPLAAAWQWSSELGFTPAKALFEHSANLTFPGKLMRMIMFSSQRVTANNMETLFFILFLLAFALSASGYVFVKGLENTTRSRYKLLLKCLLIITSVVPPELPTELTMAVNTSLQRLQKLGVYCTEPYRIPFAGKIDTCCFDKTGTLTDEHLVLQGVAGISPDSPLDLITPQDIYDHSSPATYVMAACHSVSNIEREVVGDPMETETLDAIQWNYVNTPYDMAVCRKKHKEGSLRIRQRFYFNATLARMSVIASIDHLGHDGKTEIPVWVLCKGAPEVLANHLKTIPPFYQDTYLYYARQGKRVIATAYKEIPKGVDSNKMSREEAESNLIFSGFIIFECPIKADSVEAIKQLKNSSHNIMMITGDNPLTACHVARELNIPSKPLLILEPVGEKDDQAFQWKLLATQAGEKEEIKFPFEPKSLSKLLKEYDFCLYGKSLSWILNSPARDQVLPFAKVIARASPDQKTEVLVQLKDNSQVTLMCGDGTNDVGALKQSHVGVALLNKPIVQEDEKAQKEKEKEKAKEKAEANATRAPPKGAKGRITNLQKKDEPKTLTMKQMRKQYKAQIAEKKRQWEQHQEESSVVKLGDASIASPFTSKSSSVLPIAHILRQGRATLVTTHQMFRILALNCLTTAYGLSVLFLDGIKMGDWQQTVMGFLIAFCFLSITKAEPQATLSAKRPLSRLFSLYTIIGIAGQFLIHISALIRLVDAAKTYRTFQPHPEADFTPNLQNTAVFLIMNLMQIINFAANYEGHPFMDSIFENISLLASLSGCLAVNMFAAFELSPAFNAWFELVAMPPDFRTTVLGTMALDAIGVFTWEKICRVLFT